jgi:ParB family chromosome partitioning protein
MGKKSLGRGLNAIFQDKNIVEDMIPDEGSLLQTISLSKIDPNPFQPRKTFKDEEIEDLAQTIKEHGIIQPITVRKSGNRFQIIAGERRLRACRHLQMEEVEAKIFPKLTDKQMAEWALIENIQRVELSPIEEANSYQQLINIHEYTHEQLASRLGKSRSAITNTLRLIRLPEIVQEYIDEGSLSAGHARTLINCQVMSAEDAAREIIDRGYSVREAEKKFLKSPLSASLKTPVKESKDPNLTALEQELQYSLGTKVSIKYKSGKGKIILDFESSEDLSRLHQIMTGN